MPLSFLAALLVTAALAAAPAEPGRVSFSAPVMPVEVGGLFEITVTVEAPTVVDCATQVQVTGAFTHESGGEPLRVAGFCDSGDGSHFRVQFSPPRIGEYEWRVTYRQGDFVRTGGGSLSVVERKPAAPQAH